MGSGSRRKLLRSRNRRGGGGGVANFVRAGDLSDWRATPPHGGKSRRRRRDVQRIHHPRRGNAYGSGAAGAVAEAGVCIVLNVPGSRDPVVAFEDRRPSCVPAGEIPLYSYGTETAGGSHRGLGLGFGEDDDSEERHEDGRGDVMGEDSVEEIYRTPLQVFGGEKKKSEGFLSIGSIRLYTVDVSSPEDMDDDDDEDSVDDLQDDEVMEEEEGSDASEEDEDVSDYGSYDDFWDDEYGDDVSDVDDELANDYLEGIGGISAFRSSDWIIHQNLESPDQKDGHLMNGRSRDGANEGNAELGGLDLMKASMEYGMKRRKGKKVTKWKDSGSPMLDFGSPALDKFFSVKYSRMDSRTTKSSSCLSKSWPPGEIHRDKYRHVTGGKKKHRKELIALKRRAHMINRGVDLDDINIKLRTMVLNEVDMLSFKPMHSMDCSQVQRLASIYRLKSGCQGSGRKRFVTVSRTVHTCLPSSLDAQRLRKLLGAGIEEEDFAINHEAKRRTRDKGISRSGGKPDSRTSTKDGNGGNGRKKRCSRDAASRFSDRPVSFVSSGAIQPEPTPGPSSEPMAVDLPEPVSGETSAGDGSSKVGAFEMHTTGFGSRMLAKMGYIEDGGLGKDGQGMAQPIEVVRRPKSLGLGVEFVEETEMVVAMSAATDRRADAGGSIGSFEKHTRGFGSKMMAKMGFVAGAGLGKNSQGITRPPTAVRLPRSRGLGAKS